MSERPGVPLSHHLVRGTAGHLPGEQDSRETASGTPSLKALAALALRRDSGRDSTEISVPQPETPSGQLSRSVPRVPNVPGCFDVSAESGLPDSWPAFQLCSGSTTKTTETTKVGLDITAGDATAGSISWADGFAALSGMPTPSEFSPKRWRRIIDAMGIFLDRWGNQAAQCGWSDLDLFGCHLDRPDARFDCMGLVLLLDRAEVISLDCEAATLKTRTGSELRYRRRPMPAGSVPLWDLR